MKTRIVGHPTAAFHIESRIRELEAMRERYIAYQDDRVREQDLHACWDVAIDIGLTDYEIKGLRFALDAITKETK